MVLLDQHACGRERAGQHALLAAQDHKVHREGNISLSIWGSNWGVNTIDRHTITFTAAFAQILGTYKKGDKLEKDQNFKKGDKTCSKV